MQTGTVQDTDDPPARQKKCTAAGNAIQIQRYDDQAEATNSVVLGKADAVLADSPVMAGAVKKVGGGLDWSVTSTTPRRTASRSRRPPAPPRTRFSAR